MTLTSRASGAAPLGAGQQRGPAKARQLRPRRRVLADRSQLGHRGVVPPLDRLGRLEPPPEPAEEEVLRRPVEDVVADLEVG
jgi:hypothetical protein